MIATEPGAVRNPITTRQIDANRRTRAAWDRCAAHRARLSAIVEEAVAGARRLCVLGAGNCNDLDLARLGAAFREIHLVDIDRQAVDTGLLRQSAPRPIEARICVRAPIDLSGVIGLAGGPDRSRLDAAVLARGIDEYAPAIDGAPFDVVLSAGLLSQMYMTIHDLGLPPDDAARLVVALRRRHLADLARLSVPGGAFILVSDVVATTTAPDLPALPEARLGDRMRELVDAGNFFTGQNPAALWEDLSGLGERAVHDPWLWPLAESHSYLVWAVVVRRPAI